MNERHNAREEKSEDARPKQEERVEDLDITQDEAERVTGGLNFTKIEYNH